MHDDLFNILRKDHEVVKELFQELAVADDRLQREKLASKLYLEIESHMAAEEKAVYPSMNKTGEAWGSALKAMEEHGLAKIMLEEVLDTPGDDERFRARAAVLADLVLHHIEDEEKTIFGVFARVVSHDEGQGVLDGFESEKKRRREALETETVTT
jgi:hemerythrin-like domain-containing protein